ncbi:uncharacterized protein B4U79_05648, partial [Dinothrombium tinctorium]
MAVMNKASPHCILGNDFNIKAGILMNFAHMKIGMVEIQPQVNVILPGEETSTSELVDSRDKQAMKSESESCSVPNAIVTGGSRSGSDLLKDEEFLKIFKIGSTLSIEERKSIAALLRQFRCCFSFSMSEIGCVKGIKHRIDTGAHLPINQSPYRVSPKERKIIKNTVDELLENDIIRPSFSPWASPVILVPKRGSDIPRMVVDYRKLNAVTTPRIFPISNVDDFIFLLYGSALFASMDVFERLKIHNLRLKPSKCEFAVDRVKFLGHEISLKGIEPDQERVIAIRGMKPPVDVKGIKSFLDADCISRHLAVDPGEDEDIDDIP